jgi:Beta protein
MPYKYFPVLRSRLQEMDVLEKFEFGERIAPIVEIVKEKARSNQRTAGHEDFANTLATVRAGRIILDLPIYLDPSISTATEVREFFLGTISDLRHRISYYRHYRHPKGRVIPVISVLQPHSDEPNTLITQFQELEGEFPQLAIRIFINGFDIAFRELQKIQLRSDDLILYDLDTTEITNPLVRLQKKTLDEHYRGSFQAVIRSAINTDIQNVKLDHGEVIPEANNSLLELYHSKPYQFPAFGDYAGVKKDDISTGGTISPGFIFYNPEDNLYYGYKGRSKSLDEFERTIVPDVLNSPIIRHWEKVGSPYLRGNQGYDRLQRIRYGQESGKSQAKFKWISIMHYLHCIKVKIDLGEL